MRRPLIALFLLLTGSALGIAVTLGWQYVSGPKQTVNVTGTGRVEAQADQAFVSVTVTSTSQANNKTEVDGLKEKLLKLGIPESRITQSDWGAYSMGVTVPAVPPEKMMIPDTQPLLPYRPNVTSNLTITLDPITRINEVYAAIAAVPTAKISSTNYSLKNSTEFESQAREKAVEDARNQAETIAKINHLRVGKLINLSNLYTPMMYKGADAVAPSMATREGSSQPSYTEKTIPITATFSVTYELY